MIGGLAWVFRRSRREGAGACRDQASSRAEGLQSSRAEMR